MPEGLLNVWQVLAQALHGASRGEVLDEALVAQPVACRRLPWLLAAHPGIPGMPSVAGLILCIIMPKSSGEGSSSFFPGKMVHL